MKKHSTSKSWSMDQNIGDLSTVTITRKNALLWGWYPEVSLKKARDKRDEARKLLASGVDPAENRKAMKAAQVADGETFEVIAREWFAKKKDSWAPCHSERILRRLEANIFPWLGNLPIANIDAPKLLAVLHRIERRGALESAHRMLQTCGQIFRYAIATGRTERDLSVDLRGALSSVKSKNFAAITEPDKIKDLLQAIDAYPGSFIVQCGLKLAPLIFVRPGELRMAEWQDFNFDTAEWRYTTSKTKTQHIVPLATQVITILRELHPLTGHGRYVFPSARTPNGSRPMSDAALLVALRRMGFGQSLPAKAGSLVNAYKADY
jgi:integrase